MRSHFKRNFTVIVTVVCCYTMIRIIKFGIAKDYGKAKFGVSSQLQASMLNQAPLVQPQIAESHNQMGNRSQDSQKKASCSTRLLDVPSSIHLQDPSYKDVTCLALLTADEKDSVYDTAKSFMKKYPVKKVPDRELTNLVKDCQKFKSTRGYHMEVGSQEEKDFPIAFNLLVHTDVHQVEQLLRAIYRPQNQYCIHMDDKQSSDFKQAIVGLANCFENVFLASKMERVVYAGFTRLQADITCMQDHLKFGKTWKYLFNVAGQAFPIKTNKEMVEILKIYNGANDIEGIIGNRIHRSRYCEHPIVGAVLSVNLTNPEQKWTNIRNKRFEAKWIEKDADTDHAKMEKTEEKNPKPPFDIEIVRGSAYGVFSREFTNFVINDERAVALLEWSRYTWSPDEHYWATLHHTYYNPHLRTPGGYNSKPDKKRWLAVWVAWGGENKCHGKWVRGICVFGVADLPKIASREEFFINKLYYDFEPLTLECLSNLLEDRVLCPREIDRAFYQSLPFIIQEES